MAGSKAPFKAIVAPQGKPTSYNPLDLVGKQGVRIRDAFAACPDAQVSFVPDATKEALLNAIHAAATACSKEDILFVFVSGHGLLFGDQTWRLVVNDTRPDSAEVSGISIDELLIATKETIALGVVLLIDTCFSGHVVLESGAWDRLKMPVLAVIAATSPDARSWESPGLNGTAFGAALEEALKQGVGDRDIDQTIELSSLNQHLGVRSIALSKLYAVETSVHGLVLRSPATTTLWRTPIASPDVENNRPKYTARDVFVKLRRAFIATALSAVAILVVLAGYSRVQQTARLDGELAEVRTGASGLGWFQGDILRIYSGIAGPPPRANWFRRESIGEAIPRRFHVEKPIDWMAGKSLNWTHAPFELIESALGATQGNQPDTSALLGELDGPVLERLFASANDNWSPSIFEALSLVSPDRSEAILRRAATEPPNQMLDAAWRQGFGALQPPCSPFIDHALEQRKGRTPFQAGAIDIGAYLAGCKRTVDQLMVAPINRVDRAAEIITLFRREGTDVSDLNQFNKELAKKIAEQTPKDAADDVRAIVALASPCDPVVIEMAKRYLDTEDTFAGFLPNLLACSDASADAREDLLLVSIPAVAAHRLVYKAERLDWFQHDFWSRVALAIVQDNKSTEAAKAWAAAALVGSTYRTDGPERLTIWSTLDARLPYPRQPMAKTKQIPGSELALWFGCTASGLEATKASDFEVWDSVAIGAVACGSRQLREPIAALNPWTLGFINAAMGSPDAALIHLNAISPAERAGAAQGVLTREDAIELLPAISRMRVGGLPNPEAAPIALLLKWRDRFAGDMGLKNPESCRTVAAVLGGFRNWDSLSAVGQGNPGLRTWLMAATLGRGPCSNNAKHLASSF